MSTRKTTKNTKKEFNKLRVKQQEKILNSHMDIFEYMYIQKISLEKHGYHSMEIREKPNKYHIKVMEKIINFIENEINQILTEIPVINEYRKPAEIIREDVNNAVLKLEMEDYLSKNGGQKLH